MFLNEYEKKTGIVISINEIDSETIWLYKDEVDEHFISLEVLETLDEIDRHELFYNLKNIIRLFFLFFISVPFSILVAI